ncbi:FadR/GntR family transcriptional regulator [Phytohalomonas tamaricis]|uniref:FadR/GntR family transcriptional regulator n=1 Tax=Phytohalomonas tamaricis TaxID=2081032 RepID=UPI000D0ACB51|nr:FCD domain-containing protein [Phytohalomonas tamaricis]
MQDTVTSSLTGRDELLEALAQAIFEGRYPPGELLPRELDLCAQHGVSRATARSAIQTLVETGIVSRLAGHGTRVQPLSNWKLLDPRVTDWMIRHASPNPAFQNDIFAFRMAVEPFVAMLAAREANGRDLLAIEEAFEGMTHTLDAPDRRWQGKSHDDYDLAFHTAIFEATHNLVWAQLAHMLRPSIMLIVETTNHSAGALKDSLERHRRVMEAIRLRQEAEAYAAARAVLERTAQDLGVAQSSVPASLMDK